jgi:signal transduction histidine kinase
MLFLFYAVPNYVMPLLEPIWLQPGQVKFQTLRSQGVANILAEQLNSRASGEELDNVNLDNFPYAVSVQNLNDIALTEKQKGTLLKNTFWVHPKTLFSYMVLERSNRVLIIGNADTPKESALSFAQREIMGTVFMLTQKLNATPIEHWKALTNKLSLIFRYPIAIVSMTEVSLSNDELEQLKQGRLVTQTAQGGYEYGSGIDHFYQQLPNGSILTGGPIAPYITEKLIAGNITIFLTIGAFIALILMLWLLPTWRSTNHLKQVTSQFSAQDYSSRMPILFASLLNPQARTFNQMAQRTEQLFTNNQQLIRLSSRALRQPLDIIESQLNQYVKNSTPQGEILDQMEQSVNDMRDITSLILAIGKFNREKESLNIVHIKLIQWVNGQSEQWKALFDQQLVIKHSINDKESKFGIDIDPYYLNIAIIHMLRLSQQTSNALELCITLSPKVSQITTYQNNNETSINTLTGLTEQYLLQLAQQCNGQMIQDLSTGTITLEIPNVLS